MKMRKTKQQLEKITKYSIRKLTVGVGPVAIGAFLFGASTLSVDKVQANEVGVLIAFITVIWRSRN